jgi:hypothetical protein
MGALDHLQKVVLFRKGDTVQDIQTGERHYVTYVHISKYDLMIVTSNGSKLPSYKLRNLTWIENNIKYTPEESTEEAVEDTTSSDSDDEFDIDNLFE